MRLRDKIADWISGGAATKALAYHAALEAIEVATHSGKSGTAIKINRMAREALK